MSTHLHELRDLQRRANRAGIKVAYFVNTDGIIDQSYIVGFGAREGLRDPLTTAEYLRKLLANIEQGIRPR
jgi:hypothetical protein